MTIGNAASRARANASIRDDHPLRVLLVNDSLDDIDAHTALLRLQGASVRAATCFEEALHVSRAEVFDVLVMSAACAEVYGALLLGLLRSAGSSPLFSVLLLPDGTLGQRALVGRRRGFNVCLDEATFLLTFADSLEGVAARA